MITSLCAPEHWDTNHIEQYSSVIQVFSRVNCLTDWYSLAVEYGAISVVIAAAKRPPYPSNLSWNSLQKFSQAYWTRKETISQDGNLWYLWESHCGYNTTQRKACNKIRQDRVAMVGRKHNIVISWAHKAACYHSCSNTRAMPHKIPKQFP